MIIIPALDIRAGRLVRPNGGRRDGYPPWRSPLAPGGDVVAALSTLRRRFDFSIVYLADLDRLSGISDSGVSNSGISDSGVSDSGISDSGVSDFDPRPYLSLARRFPEVNFWIDAGMGTALDCRAWPDHPSLVPIIASETLRDLEQLRRIHARWGRQRFILSLDCRAGGSIEGPRGLLDMTAYWPETLIILGMDRVARRQGPDRHMLRKITSRLALRCSGRNHRIVIGGGIRHAVDIENLAKDGADAALMASALHDGTVGKAEMSALRRRFRSRMVS